LPGAAQDRSLRPVHRPGWAGFRSAGNGLLSGAKPDAGTEGFSGAHLAAAKPDADTDTGAHLAAAKPDADTDTGAHLAAAKPDADTDTGAHLAASRGLRVDPGR